MAKTAPVLKFSSPPQDRRQAGETGRAARRRPAARPDLLEITDSRDRPLLLMPPEAAPRQGLYSRFACVALFGTGKILHLFRRVFPGVGFEGRWDFCFGPVRPGEAREDAARRLLLEQAGLADLRTVEILRRPADADLPGHLTFFSARLPLGGILDDREFLAVDADELEGLVAHCPDFFTPALLWAAGGGWLFS